MRSKLLKGKNASVIIQLVGKKATEEQPAGLECWAGQCGSCQVSNGSGQVRCSEESLEHRGRIEAKWAEMGLKVALGHRAKELKTLQGLRDDQMDVLGDVGGTGDPGFAFGGFDLKPGTGECLFPFLPYNLEGIWRSHNGDIVDVRQDEDLGDEFRREGGLEQLDGGVQPHAEGC